MLALASLLFVSLLITALVSESIEQCLVSNQTTQMCIEQCQTTQHCTWNCKDTLEPIVNFENCQIIHINLSEGDATLTETLNVSNVQEISIAGVNTTVTCLRGSGLKFENISTVNIESVHFIGCGTVTSHHIGTKTEENINFHYAVLIGGCQNVSILHSSITNSYGAGLVLLNNNHIDIAHSMFNQNIFNASDKDEAGGGGIYLEFSCNHVTPYRKCNKSKFTINHCSFKDNHASAQHNKSDDGYSGVGNGGGLQLWVYSSSDNILTVNNSNFQNNFANWGGGLQIIFADDSKNNSVRLENCNIDSNFVHYRRGGGGLDVGYVQGGVSGNRICLNRINFTNNSGLFGGGMAVFTLDTSEQEENAIFWNKCRWIDNTANYGAALNIAPQHIFHDNKELTLRFTQCRFDSNKVFHHKVKKNIVRRGKGIIMITGGVSTFKDSVSFLNNNSTAIYAISSTILILKDTTVLFTNNTARNGAGISLIGFSTIVVGQNTSVTFCNNSVSRNGAAIYHYSIDKNAYIYSRTCFIQKLDPVQSSKNVFFNFFGNTAYKNPVYNNGKRKADAIYGTSITACSTSRDNNNSRYDFYDVGNFRSCNSCLSSTLDVISECEHMYTEPPVLTDEGDVSIALDSKYKDFIPGKKFNNTLEEKGTEVQTLYYVTIQNDNGSNITIPNAFTVVTRKILLRGKPGDTATVTFTELYFRRYSISIRVRAMDCPPLYTISNDLTCVCISNADLRFVEFHKCLNGIFQASIRLGYWISYENETGNGADRYTLLNSYYPLGYGSFENGMGDDYGYHKLPGHFNREELNKIICNSRTGILCGLCEDDLTVYFHSEYFRCGTVDLCYLGPLFYFISEILPLTLLFVFIIFFNISFTSGYLNGFIFFAQMYDTISNIGGSFILPSNQFSKFSVFHRLLFKLFNIDFFDIENLSFCLFKTTRTLDILVFKYVSVGYAFFLVIGTIWAIRCCSKFRSLQIRRSRYSIIQGLSAFLVMVYSQCTYVSFSILNQISIYNGAKVFNTVPFLQGNIDYFGKEHLKYALPAIFCIVFFLAPLPLLLIIYPLCNKVVVFLGIHNNFAIKWTSRLIPITKIKPLLDCFQGTFKDNFRFFAGLYFLYRVTIILSRLASGVILIFMVIEIQLIVMLALHTLILPYQSKLHNMIDIVVFADLAIINGLKLLNFFYAENSVHSEGKINTIHGIQLFFIYLPLIGIIILILCKFINRFKGVLLRSVKLFKMPHKMKGTHTSSRASDDRVQELDIEYDNFDDDYLDSDRSNFATESYRMVRKKKLNMLAT